MIEGSGAGSGAVYRTNGSGKPKNIRILRIHNTAFYCSHIAISNQNHVNSIREERNALRENYVLCRAPDQDCQNLSEKNSSDLKVTDPAEHSLKNWDQGSYKDVPLPFYRVGNFHRSWPNLDSCVDKINIQTYELVLCHCLYSKFFESRFLFSPSYKIWFLFRSGHIA
jgi:hypothetical protein